MFSTLTGPSYSLTNSQVPIIIVISPCNFTHLLTANHGLPHFHRFLHATVLPSTLRHSPPSLHPRGSFHHQLRFHRKFLWRSKKVDRRRRHKVLIFPRRLRFRQGDNAVSFRQSNPILHCTLVPFPIQLLLPYLSRHQICSSLLLPCRLPFLSPHRRILLRSI